MIKADIQIENGEIHDSYDEYGLIYMESDSRMSAPTKDYDSSSYIDEPGEHIDSRTVEAPFDFKISFLIEAHPHVHPRRVNARINALNKDMFERVDNGVLRARQVKIYDHYKSRLIAGFPKPISEPTEYYNVRGHQIAIVELLLRVTDPTLCDWEYVTNRGIGEMVIGSTFVVG